MAKVALITGITGQDGSYLGRVFVGEGDMRFMELHAVRLFQIQHVLII